MSKRPRIGDAMREVSGGTRAGPREEAAAERTAGTGAQPGGVGTKAITGHFAPEVRAQLKILAAEQGRTMEDMMAEALNMLFATYGKPEIAASGARAIRSGT